MNNILSKSFSVKGTHKQLAKVEALLLKCNVVSDERWNSNQRGNRHINHIIYSKRIDSDFAYHSHCGDISINPRRSPLSYRYVIAELNKIIKDYNNANDK